MEAVSRSPPLPVLLLLLVVSPLQSSLVSVMVYPQSLSQLELLPRMEEEEEKEEEEEEEEEEELRVVGQTWSHFFQQF